MDETMNVKKCVRKSKLRFALRLMAMLLIAVGMLVMLTACGGAGDAAETPAPEETPAATPGPTAKPTPEPTPEPTPFPEPELTEDCPVTMDGTALASGSFLHDGVRYVYLSEAADALGLEPEIGEDGQRCSFPWRKSRVELQAESDELNYLEESVRLEAPVLLCRGGEEMLLPVESFCQAIQIGLLYDEEMDHLYCTPGAGDWELPQGYYVPVMMYHGVGGGDETANLFVEPSSMEEQIVYMLENGYTPIWFSDLEHVEDYEKPVLLTYDDGWKNTYFNLLPLVEKYHVKVTIFMICEAFEHSGNHLDPDQALEMAASGYVDFQSHTMSHANLLDLTTEQREYEMRESRLFLTRMFGKEPFVLAYPIGGSNEKIQELTSHYYRFGVKMFENKRLIMPYNTSDDPMSVYRFFPEKRTQLSEYVTWLASAFPPEGEEVKPVRYTWIPYEETPAAPAPTEEPAPTAEPEPVPDPEPEPDPGPAPDPGE